MANNNKIPIRGHFQFNFSEDVYNKYQQVSNKTQLITELLEKHFNDNIIDVKIDDAIKQKFEEDPYKDIRIRLLLLEFYTKGNINTLINNNDSISLSASTVNKTSLDVNNNEISIDNSELTQINKQNQDFNINKSSEAVNDNNINIKESESNSQYIKADDNLNENTEDISTNINDIKELNIDNSIGTEEESKDTFDIPIEKTGSIKSMFKNNIPRNNKNLL